MRPINRAWLHTAIRSFYIGTKQHTNRGYEINSSPVTADAEDILLKAIKTLLEAKK